MVGEKYEGGKGSNNKVNGVFLKGIELWHNFQEHLPAGRQGTRDYSISACLDDDPSRSGQAMVSGLTANAVLYPAPPVLPAALTTLVLSLIHI